MHGRIPRMGALASSGLLLLAAALAPAQAPAVNSGGVVDAATFRAPVAPGSLVSIFGIDLAPAAAATRALPLPTTLGEVSVSFNGVAAPLLYVSPTQINAQLPWEVSATGAVNVTVTNSGVASAPQSVQVAASAPGLYALEGRAVAINPDGSLAAPDGSIPGYVSHPATPGAHSSCWPPASDPSIPRASPETIPWTSCAAPPPCRLC